MKVPFQFVFALFFLTLSSWSWAQQACKPTSGSLTINAANATLRSAPAHKTGSTVAYAAGEMLGTPSTAINTALIHSNWGGDWDCFFWRTTGAYPLDAELVAGVTHNGAPVFETGVPGIGYSLRIADTNGAFIAPQAPAGTETLIFQHANGQAGGMLNAPGFRAEVTFVSTGSPIQLGKHAVNNLLAGIISAENRRGIIRPGAVALIIVNATFEVPPLSCSVTSGNTLLLQLPTVPFNDVLKMQVNDMAGAAPESPVQNVAINCPAGIQLYATVVDANNTGNITDKLSTIQSANSAKGVSVGLRRAENSATNQWYQVFFGPDSTQPGNTNQWLVRSFASAAGNTTLHFKTKYIRTSEYIAAGTVEAKALLVFSYQ